MKIYNALIKKNKEGKIEDIILLKEGFSFFAFLFNGLWFLYHKMWSEFLAILLVNFLIAYMGDFLPVIDKILLEISFIFLVALNANYWLCEYLKKKDYNFVGLVFGHDKIHAKLRFLKNLKADSNPEFDYSITNPKLHRKMLKLQKSKTPVIA
jgi:hypothetical protein